MMRGFLAIFGAAIGGYTGMPPWVIAASAIALASLSAAKHYRLYRRGQELGLSDVLDRTMLKRCLTPSLRQVAHMGVVFCSDWSE